MKPLTGAGALSTRVRIDQAVNVSLPHKEYFAEIDHLDNLVGLGATSDFKQVSARASAVETIGRWTGRVARHPRRDLQLV